MLEVFCNEQDLTPFVTAATWGGDIEQAARHFRFSIAYNPHDKSFPLLDLHLGDDIYAYYSDENQPRVEIFRGRIFYRKRATNEFVYQFVAYDNLVYLAKSKVHKVFTDIPVADVFTTICGEMGVPCEPPEVKTRVSFIADGKSCTEVFKTLSDKVKAVEGYTLYPVSIDGSVRLVKRGTRLDYIATDYNCINKTEHSDSIENMINKVVAVDETGAVKQVYTNDEDLKYGILQDVYTMQPPSAKVDNAAEAQAHLKPVEEESSLDGIGNIQCITGYCLTVQEEQLQGVFFIKSDSHTFSDGQHMMTLALVYQEAKDEKDE